MNWYEEKQEAKRERLEARADRLRREGAAKFESGMDRLRAIPFGQPILVGHHSEKRDRNYRAKAVGAVDKGIELQKMAGDLDARAASIGSGGISSDDPDAVVKLKEQLAELEAKQEKMKAVNVEWRKAGNKAGRQSDGSWLDKPYSFELTNNGANIRRIQQRIEYLSANANRETVATEMAGGIKLIENADINRVQIKFPGKPAAEIRGKLKAAGFRWSPTEGAWQRQLNSSAVYWAKQLVEEITKAAPNAPT